MSDNQAVEIRKQARDRALKIIEQNPGCVSYVRPEDLNTQSLFIPVVSVIKPTREDFYDLIPEIGIMGKPPLVNLIREKAGVEILRTETEKRGEWIWHAHVYGQKRQPDGTMIPGDASYEFDVEKRCKLDFITNPTKYPNDIAKEKHLLKTAKFGEQRAVTGAQHALIHKLAHVARSFKTPEELMRGMIVCRIDRNIDGMLADPEMKKLAMNQAIGVTMEIYGSKKPLAIEADAGSMEPAAQAEAQSEAEAEPVPETDATDLFEDDLPWEQQKPADRLKTLLKSCKKETEERALAWLAKNPSDAEIEEKIKALNAAIDKTAQAAQAKGATA
jgi:hypothetical protein